MAKSSAVVIAMLPVAMNPRRDICVRHPENMPTFHKRSKYQNRQFILTRLLRIKAGRVLAGELAELRVVVADAIVVLVAGGVRLAVRKPKDRVHRRVGLAGDVAKRVVRQYVRWLATDVVPLASSYS